MTEVSNLKLTIFATTDVHGAIYPFNYFKGEKKETGLLKFKYYIENYKKNHPDEIVLTVDNGDLLQGDVWSEYDSVHRDAPLLPAIINDMYDVIGLGNHEFNFGLPFLSDFYKQVNIPVLNSNVDFLHGDLGNLIKKSMIKTIDTKFGPLKIGFLSVVPTQIMKWDKFNLTGRVKVSPMPEAVTKTAEDLKRQGADLIILLSHSGMSAKEDDQVALGENQAMRMALVTSIDGIVLGHTHDLFPHESMMIDDERLNMDEGTFNEVPMVQPGVSASHLGVLKFDLDEDKRLKSASGQLISGESIEDNDDYLLNYEHDHEQVLNYLEETVGYTREALQTYFARVIPSRAVQIVSEAVVWFAEGLEAVKKENLPILGFNSAIKTGRDGIKDFTDIPVGKLTVADTIDLYKHANTTVIIKINGKVLKEWLEWSASSFNQVGASSLIKSNHSRDGFPGYNFDTFFDLDYTFDLSQPARYHSSAHQISDTRRLVEVKYDGLEVKDDGEFLVPANNYKVAYAPFLRDAEIVYESSKSIRDILNDFIKAEKDFVDKRPMTLIPDGEYQFVTATKGKYHLGNLPIKHVRDHGNGLSTFQVTL